MAIPFGIYDFFSNTIPGALYILAFNQLLVLLKITSIDIDQISTNLGIALGWAVVSYVVGHLMDFFAIRWYLLFNRRKVESASLSQLKVNYPFLKIKFGTQDRRVLFSAIRHENLELAEAINKFKALSIMLQNISLALAILSEIQLTSLALNKISLELLLSAILPGIFSIIAMRRSALFNQWYWSGIFEQSLHYGTSVAEIVRATTKRTAKK